ncbi:MAG: dihydroorotate dehydrogenase electron transfer subunit [Candidatus Omnitrophica bacterium]|nr:dihydroorotate dehydrogenase electron transfer subunit [Candidatus Omnitrophota bacterium]MDD5670986.1 dihydroorotate dehydrogenase electron transfer subunit [Candidatus Omnitrophota bacterium]
MPSKVSDEVVTLIENRKINQKYFKLVFQSRGLSKNVKPGQFVQLQIQPAQDPFLRRPFSYFRVCSDRIEILYEILGRGTSLLARKKKGDRVRVMGPLGRPFTEKVGQKKRILVGGGIGVPPLMFLAERCSVDCLLIGVKSKEELLPKREMAQVKGKVLFSTDDGSYGEKGYVTELLKKVLKEESSRLVYIQTCGPNVMMREVMKIAKKKGIEGEASMDERMACGIGACLGCMVETRDGLVPSCKEGPVFSFENLV